MDNQRIQEQSISSFIEATHKWSYQNGENFHKRIRNAYVNLQQATINNCSDDDDMFCNILFKLLQEQENYWSQR